MPLFDRRSAVCSEASVCAHLRAGDPRAEAAAAGVRSCEAVSLLRGEPKRAGPPGPVPPHLCERGTRLATERELLPQYRSVYSPTPRNVIDTIQILQYILLYCCKYFDRSALFIPWNVLYLINGFG